MIRTFIAIPVEPTEQLGRLMGTLRKIGRPVRTIDPQQLHITLTFLGETPSQRIPAVCELMDSIAERTSLLDCSLVGVGSFPNLRRPRVVWVGCQPIQPLLQLANSLADALESLGFPREGRRFRPHLTVARLHGKLPVELAGVVEPNSSQKFGQFPFDRMVYFESTLSRSGPQYSILHESLFSDDIQKETRL